MKFKNAVKKYGPGIAGFTLLPASMGAFASEMSDAAVAALGTAETDATTVGVALVGVAVLIGIVFLFTSMVKKH